MIPKDLMYTEEHEWLRTEDNKVVIGITDFAQNKLGDVVFVDLPEVGLELQANTVLGGVESVKAVSDIYAPCSGRIVVVNEALADTPNLINEDPYGAGWLVEMEVEEAAENLLAAAEYEEFLAKGE